MSNLISRAVRLAVLVALIVLSAATPTQAEVRVNEQANPQRILLYNGSITTATTNGTVFVAPAAYKSLSIHYSVGMAGTVPNTTTVYLQESSFSSSASSSTWLTTTTLVAFTGATAGGLTGTFTLRGYWARLRFIPQGVTTTNPITLTIYGVVTPW